MSYCMTISNIAQLLNCIYGKPIIYMEIIKNRRVQGISVSRISINDESQNFRERRKQRANKRRELRVSKRGPEIKE